jgi:uncharacterized protein (DUF302 family)
MKSNGLITLRGDFDFETTMARLESNIASRGMAVLARIDHAAAARKAGLSLRPTTVVIFGNAKVGTALMQDTQSVGLDLPLKVLVWQDQGGTTSLSYNQVSWLAERHAISVQGLPVVEKMTRGLEEICRNAARNVSHD